MTDHDAWLAQVIEAPLEPDLPICDPHHHLWDRPGNRYFLADLVADLDCGHNLVSTVFVECTAFYHPDGPVALRPVGETEFVEREVAPAAGGPVAVAEGLVAYADLTLGAAVSDVLAAHRAASPTRLRGIRHAVAWDASPDIGGYKEQPPGTLLDARFREGYAQLAAHGLSFDAWLYHPQLAELADLARAFPETTIVLDHVGGPLMLGPYGGLREQAYQHWRGAIAMLARCENVVVKVGGLGQANPALGLELRPTPPTSVELAETIAPYVLAVIDAFGPARCMFESNFPVDKASFSYGVMWNAFKRVSARYTPIERADLFYGTAARVYRLG
jgi:L-fuconolactonase